MISHSSPSPREYKEYARVSTHKKMKVKKYFEHFVTKLESKQKMNRRKSEIRLEMMLCPFKLVPLTLRELTGGILYLRYFSCRDL